MRWGRPRTEPEEVTAEEDTVDEVAVAVITMVDTVVAAAAVVVSLLHELCGSVDVS